MTTTTGLPSWFRQFQVLLTKNQRLLLRRPFHLLVLLLSSVVSVVFAWLAGRDARGPSGEFPPLTDCGMVDPEYYREQTMTTDSDGNAYYYGYSSGENIPVSLNEAWRGGLPVWLMSLGPTFAAISVFLILRDELQSRRWGMLKAADPSAHWLSWLFAFTILGIINSLAGGITAAVMPNVHAMESVNFASIFGTLLFLNVALTAASFFLAALCGTIQSLTLTIFLIMGIIVASSAPAIAISASSFSYYNNAGLSTSTYMETGMAGSFWLYSSTERATTNYDYIYDENTGEYSDLVTFGQCEVPLVSYDQSRYYKTKEEQNNVPKEDIFQGCFTVGGASSSLSRSGVNSFFWFLIPQTHFLKAWSNILGYTSMPGNTFSFKEASLSPEVLAEQSLSNYKGGAGYDASNSNGTSLFSQGSTVVIERYYDYTQNNYYGSYYDEFGNYEQPEYKSTCPSSEVSNQCSGGNTECPNPRQGYPSDGSPSVNDSLGYLVALVAIYSLLAGYISTVLPMKNGAANKFYFPFQISFWCAKHRHNESEEQDGVEAVNVSKTYGKVEALKPFNLKMQPSQVTALLGHNGAGKSTFVNLLCCEQNQTGGDILVKGHSVASSQQTIRKMMGECKQDDILWPNLTALEHLELFGGIRGVPKADIAAVTQKWLESVDLENVQHVRAGAFSGGMKRRLSVALATIGHAPIVVLDEPTTGMDPVSRRFVWKHISEIKAGRVILLTTHAMEEADLLSDHVAILSNGNLEAFGSPLELKSQYGSALQFSLICNEKDDSSIVKEAVNNTFADSLDFTSFESGVDSAYCTLTIKKVSKGKEDGVSVHSLSSFIGWLEDDKSPVSEFGISNSSLEEVFLAVTRDASPAVDQVQHNHGCCCGCCCCCGKRQAKTSAETEHFESTNQLPMASQAVNQLPKVNISSYSRSLSVASQILAIVRFLFARNWTGRPSIVNWVIFSIFCAANMINGFGMATIWPDPTLLLLLIVTVGLMSSMLISIISPIFSDRNNGLLKMMSTQSMMEASYITGTALYSLSVQLIYSFIFLTLFFASNIFRTPTVPECDADEASSYYDDWYASSYSSSYSHCGRGYTKFGDKPTIYYKNEIFSDGEASVSAHFATGGYEMLLGIIFVFSWTVPGAVLTSAFIPGHKITLIAISLVLLTACVSPIILYAVNLNDPEFLQNCLNETGNFGELGLDNINDNSLDMIGHRVVNPLTLPIMFCNPAHISILPQMGLFQTLALTLVSDIVFHSEPKEYAEDDFIKKLVEGGASCSGNRCKFGHARELYGKNLGFMFLGAALLLALGIIMSALILYPPAFMIRAKHAVGRLFKCRRNNILLKTEEIEELKEVDTERQLVKSAMQPFLAEPEDLETGCSTPILSQSAISSNRDQIPPMIMHKLRKVFPPLGGAPSKVALKSLDLHVPKGEVLGLLGKNGAGKTTALKILSGMHQATSGVGLISGYDVDTEINSVYERLGNCPQFDCVWKDQSVQRHLEFYARLKGIHEPVQASLDIANAVGLGAPDVYTRASGELSGGMRRRLSIAVSLLGSPDCMLLDEPSTGLDPSTRNEIWSLVSSFATPERAIIITTHMMLEADALCSRIAIVAKGALKVVGTQQHLKDNYGSGYLLQLNLAQDNEETIDSLLHFVQSNIHQDAKVVTKQAKTIHINLPRDVNIQKIFTTLYSVEAAEAMINQFLVSQSSLEDVFIALGE